MKVLKVPSANASVKILKKSSGWMIGQKRNTPLPNDSLRKFYESLYQQRPNSIMAMKWCMEHGILSESQAQEAFLILGMKDKLQLEPPKKSSKK